MKHLRTLATVGALGLALAGCGGGNNGNVVLTPQPPVNPGTQPVGPFTQIERLSRPAIKEVFETFTEHAASNAVEPYNDPTIRNAIGRNTTAFGRPAYAATFQTILYPDVYNVDVSQTAGGFLGFETGAAPFGGRNVNDDVIATELALIFGNAANTVLHAPDDGKENNCLSAQNVSIAATQQSTGTFPYLPNPL